MKQIQTSNQHRIASQQEFDDVLLENHDRISEQVRGYYVDRSSLIRKLYPGKLRKLMTAAKLNEARTELEFTQSCLHLAVDFKLSAMEEKYETWLRVIKVGYRERFYSWVTYKVKNLQETILDRETEFFDLMRKRYALIEQNKDMPSVVESYRAKMEREMETYFGWLEMLMENFQNIVREKLSDYGRRSVS